MRLTPICTVSLCLTGCPDTGQPTTLGTTGDGATAAPETGSPTTGSPPTGSGATDPVETDSTPTNTDSSGAGTTKTATTEATATTGTASTPSSCSDGVKGGDETDIDCGGGCPACEDGAACLDDADCLSNDCVDGTCAAPQCTQDRDCGQLDGPCAAGACDRGTCVATPVRNGAPCDDAKVCTAGPAACVDGVCLDPDGPVGQVDLADVVLGIGGFVIEDSSTLLNATDVALIPDINDDGLAEIAIGTPFFAEDYGRVYIVWGKSDGTKLSLSDIVTGAAGFYIQGEKYRKVGRTVAGGDFNGNGRGDLLFGQGGTIDAYFSYALFGSQSFPTELKYIQLVNSSAGIRFDVDYANAATPRALGVGDVNADGLDDMVLADYAFDASPDRPSVGRTWVVFGRPSGGVAELADIAAGDGGGFAIDGEKAYDQAGLELAVVGDVDGDGLDDVVVSLATPDDSRRAFVVFGKTTGLKVELAAIAAGDGGFVVSPEGTSVLRPRRVGDVDGDGLADVFFGDPGLGSTGRGYVLLGKADTAPVDLADVAAGNGGFAVTGLQGVHNIGEAAAPLGDLNGDGLADFMVTAPQSSVGEAAFVVFGAADTATVETSALMAGHGGYAIVGEGGNPGKVASGGHDVNGDGAADFVLGPAHLTQPFGTARVYVVYGGDCYP